MPHAEFLDRLSRQDIRYRIDAQGAIWWSIRHGKWGDRLRTLLLAVVLSLVVSACALGFNEDSRPFAYALFGVLLGITFLTGFLAEVAFYGGVVLLTNAERLPFQLPAGFDWIVGSCLLPAMLTFNLWHKSQNALDAAVRESSQTYEHALLSGTLALIPYPD